MAENGKAKKLSFTTDLIEVPVEIDGRKYCLREVSADGAVAYRNKLLGSAVLGKDEDGNLTAKEIHGLADLPLFLLSKCLFDDKGALVPLETLQGWPSRVIDPLAEKAKEISGLGDQEEEVAKNLPKS